MWAALHDHTDIVRLLIEKGSDTKLKSKSDKTALDMAKDQAIIDLLK